MELHFYPGTHALLVKAKAKDKSIIKYHFSAWGGPASVQPDQYMPPEPTWAGTYLIHSARPYRTPTWGWSKITWGTRLRDMPKKNDVWYELSNGK